MVCHFRFHAMETVFEGSIPFLLQIHTNPCFHKIKGEGSHVSLQKDKPVVLNHTDVFALLPDKLSYRVIYKSQESERYIAQVRSL